MAKKVISIVRQTGGSFLDSGLPAYRNIQLVDLLGVAETVPRL